MVQTRYQAQFIQENSNPPSALKSPAARRPRRTRRPSEPENLPEIGTSQSPLLDICPPPLEPANDATYEIENVLEQLDE